MTYHSDAVNSRENSIKLMTVIPCPVSGKEQRRMFGTRLNKIILTQLMHRENKGYETFVSFI